MEMPPVVGDEEMKVQAQHIWSMLDDMANKDPAAYKKFIDKQLKEGKEHMTDMKPPEPHMVVQTRIMAPRPEKNLFVNVMAWHQIPAPKTPEDSVPVMSGPMYDGRDEHGHHKVVTVAFHGSVLDECGINSSSQTERDLLINLAIDFLQDNHRLTLSRHYTVLGKDISVKGRLQVAQKSLTSKVNKDEEFGKELEELEKTFGPMAAGCKDSLLSQLSGIAVEEEPAFAGSGHGGTDIKLPGVTSASTPRRTGLIQELSGEEGRGGGEEGMGDVEEGTLRTPVYDLKEMGGEGDLRTLVLKVKLPDVASVAECELDIAKDDVRLFVPDKYELTLPFPSLVSSDDATAKYSRKSCTLTLTLPLV